MKGSTITWSVIFGCVIVGQASASAIPIWELLTYDEKLGRLLYIFINLVGEYCKTSEITDCRRVLSLYGTSNLLNNDEASLDLLDPYQRDGHILFRLGEPITYISMRLMRYTISKFAAESTFAIVNDTIYTVWQAALKNSFKAPDSLGKIGSRVIEEALFGFGDLREDAQPTARILPAPLSRVR